MEDRTAEMLLARLSGMDMSEIARMHGVTKQRVAQILRGAKASGKYRIAFQVTDVEGLPPTSAAKALRASLERVGLA